MSDEARVRDDLVVGRAVGALAARPCASAAGARSSKVTRTAGRTVVRRRIRRGSYRMPGHGAASRASGATTGSRSCGSTGPQARNALDTATAGRARGGARRAGAPTPDAARCSCSRRPTPARSAPAPTSAEELDRAGGVARMEAFARLYARRRGRSRRRASPSASATSSARARRSPRAATCASAATTSSSRGPGARLGVPVGPARLVPLVGLSGPRSSSSPGASVGMEEAAALGFLHRTARRRRGRGAPRWPWPREVAAHPTRPALRAPEGDVPRARGACRARIAARERAARRAGSARAPGCPAAACAR